MKVIEMSCTEVVREVSNYVENDVQGELRARIDVHLAGCAHCKAIVDGTKNIVKLVADGVELELPEGFSKRLYGKIQKA